MLHRLAGIHTDDWLTEQRLAGTHTDELLAGWLIGWLEQRLAGTHIADWLAGTHF